MGDWTVLRRVSRINGTQHLGTAWCKDEGCVYLVKEHQDVEPEVTVPEFTISVRYQPEVIEAPAHLMGHPSLKRGWRWSICWTGKDGGRKMRSGYGIQTKAQAQAKAEQKAEQIALAGLPEEVYTYRPKL